MLPTTVDVDKIEAHYQDGVLSVALPKSESARERSIQVQSGQGGLFSRLLGSRKDETKEMRDAKIS